MGRFFLVLVSVLILAWIAFVIEADVQNKTFRESEDILRQAGKRRKYCYRSGSWGCKKDSQCCSQNCVNGRCEGKVETVATSNAELPIIYEACQDKNFIFWESQTKKCVRVKTDNQNMQILYAGDCTGNDNTQIWTIIQTGRPLFRLKNVGTGMCINVHGEANFSPVQLSSCDGFYQSYNLEDPRRDDKRFQLRSRYADGKCVSVNRTDGRLYSYICGDEYDTQWFSRDGC